jgi:hypothetical protein
MNRAASGEKIPWEKRKTALYWRGRTSGGHATGTNYEKFHRQRMTEFHKKNATLYDIAFTGTVQCDEKECQEMKDKYPFTTWTTPFEDNFKHKFLIDIVRL